MHGTGHSPGYLKVLSLDQRCDCAGAGMHDRHRPVHQAPECSILLWHVCLPFRATRLRCVGKAQGRSTLPGTRCQMSSLHMASVRGASCYSGKLPRRRRPQRPLASKNLINRSSADWVSCGPIGMNERKGRGGEILHTLVIELLVESKSPGYEWRKPPGHGFFLVGYCRTLCLCREKEPTSGDT